MHLYVVASSHLVNALFPGFANYSDRMSARSRQGRRLQSLNSNLIQYTRQDNKSGKRARGAREEAGKTVKNRWSNDLTGFGNRQQTKLQAKKDI